MKLKKNIFFKNEVGTKAYLSLSLLIILLLNGFVGQSQVVTIEDVSGNEDDGAITLTATLSGGPVFGGFSVDVVSTDGSALISDNDYTAIVETLNFTGVNGQSIPFSVFPTVDTNIESSETVLIGISNLVSPFLINVDITDTATVNIDNDDVGIITIIPTNADEEGPTSGRFRIELSDNNNTGTTLTLDYTLSGAANFGALNDYTVSGATTTVSGTVTFNAIQSARNININPIDDLLVEGNEDVILTIDAISSTSYSMISNTANIIVADNDFEPTLTATDATAAEATPSIQTGEVTVDLGAVNNTGSDIVVNVSRLGASTATAADYTALPTSVSIPNGQQTGTLTITPIDDSDVEGSEDLILRIVAGTGYNLVLPVASRTATVTIADNDAYVPILTATDDTATEGTPITDTATFEVDLGAINTTGAAIPITVVRVNSLSTAIAGDFTGIPAVSVAAGAQTVTFNITPIDDDEAENLETLTLQVNASPLGDYVLGTTADRRAAMTITDNDIAGVNINTLAGTTTEAGGTADFVFTLTSQPTANVSININGYDVTETSGPTSITIEPGDWNTGTTLQITGVDDAVIDGDIEDIINTGNVTSGDPNYQAISGASVPQLTVTNLDDDGCGVTPMGNGLSTEFCGDIQANLNDYTDSTPPLGMVLRWSRSSNPFNVGARLTQDESENITSEGSFFGYFYDEANDCASGTLEIELISNEIPTIDEVTGASNCGPGSLLLSVNPSTGASVNWYDSLTGGTELGVGDTFSTGNLDTTTSFYVEAEANGCVSRERVEVIATIIPVPFPGTPSNAIACSLASTQQPLSTIDLDDRLLGNPDPGDWSFVSGPAILEIDADNVVNFLGQVEGDYIFRYTTNSPVAPCTMNISTEVTISVTADCTPDSIDLEVLKIVNNENAIAGENVIFTVIVNNLSPNTVQNIIIGDLLESGFDFISSTPSRGTYDESTGMWQIPELAAMGTATLNIEVNILAEGIYTNVAELFESFPIDDNTTNDRAEVTLPINAPEGVDLEIEKTAISTRPLIGDTVVFTIKVKNISDESTVNQIRISDVISTDFTYVFHTTVTGDYDITTGEWLIPELIQDEEAILEITVTVPNAGTFINTATIIGSVPAQIDSGNPDGNNGASVEVLVSLPIEADCGFVFNQFSPNGDGTNDFLKVQCIEQYPLNRLQIYDRYGNLVHAVTRYANNWEGEGNDGQVPDGTYFYILDLGDGTEVRKGWIQLIR
ncbi:gliding motility-associated C-terminal domain-containing protein [uncultured Maribacter sp.]|uniref:T9SS type B sorting domain-containing protein n=1 Tax=uncultured Maribacter sp. TaxID=431308 RepID=UPI00263836DF|nr:gliding motility-associated C-terminal domain-containing protein [uncultured Maribacter sp.]